MIIIADAPVIDNYNWKSASCIPLIMIIVKMFFQI